MTAYYNEFDGFKAEWLRQLVAQNLIAPGDVDERSIVDVRADDLRGYDQCHFFAGIGAWSYALRQAGRRYWEHTASGRRTSGSAGLLDDPALGRLGMHGSAPGDSGHAAQPGEPGLLDDAARERLEGWTVTRRESQSGRIGLLSSRSGDDAEFMGYAESDDEQWNTVSRAHRERIEVGGSGGNLRPGPLNGFWRDADWIGCRDGKWRPVEPGTFPLAHGSPARVLRLRGYGDAIVAPVAKAFIEAYLGCEK